MRENLRSLRVSGPEATKEPTKTDRRRVKSAQDGGHAGRVGRRGIMRSTTPRAQRVAGYNNGINQARPTKQHKRGSKGGNRPPSSTPSRWRATQGSKHWTTCKIAFYQARKLIKQSGFIDWTEVYGKGIRKKNRL